MKKAMGFSLIALALIIGIVPLFTDCLSQGRMLTTDTGKTVPMKCHWTAIAEIAPAVALGMVGLFNIFGKKKDTFTASNILGIALGAFVIAFPTYLIGVCPNNAMICNMIMKPTLIAGGTLTIAACAAALISAFQMKEPAYIKTVGAPA
jgi:hypothetical protein